MGPEINIDSILVLEKQIQEGTEDIIQLKRARNSLLNISTRVPPEILGHVFHWNIVPEGEFGGLRKGSYNFLLVCHHWFQVASGTPDLWTFWGNTLKQWSQRYQRSGTAPLDLALDASHRMRDANTIPFDGPLRDALWDRTVSDSIRSAHLKGWDTDLLRSVLSSLTLDGEGTRSSSIESLILEHANLNISNFLACYHFPKLRNLRLFTRARIASWDLLKLQSTSLTTLSLEFGETPSSPTTSQLLSILTSYPNLQDLSLYETMIPPDVGNESTFRVLLRCLKKLHLVGDCCRVFRLLDRLDYPGALDHVNLELLDCAGEGILEFLAPYLQGHIRRDHRFHGKLGIRASSIPNPNFISFKVVGKFGASTIPPGYDHPSISVTAQLKDIVPRGTGEKLCVNLVAFTPQENVVGFTGGFSEQATRELITTMPNIENLYLLGSVISDAFLRPDPPSCKKLLPSLRSLCLGHFNLQNGDDWRPLINYLVHQTSDGQAVSLRLCGEPTPVPPEVVMEIEDLVKEFNCDYPSTVWG